MKIVLVSKWQMTFPSMLLLSWGLLSLVVMVPLLSHELLSLRKSPRRRSPSELPDLESQRPVSQLQSPASYPSRRQR